ncbi:MAG: hypothetical protein LOD89_01360 [Tissierellales bacterium]
MLDIEFQEMRDKIENLCNKHNLEFNFEASKFPIIATIRPSEESKNQLTMDLGDIDDTTNFVNGEIQFIFADELTMKVVNDSRIEDGLLNKIKTQVKKLHYLYLQMYFKMKTI